MFKVALILCVAIAVVSAAPKPQGMGGMPDISAFIPNLNANAGAGGSGSNPGMGGMGGMGNWQQYLNAGAGTGPAQARAKRSPQGPLDLVGNMVQPLGSTLNGVMGSDGLIGGLLGGK